MNFRKEKSNYVVSVEPGEEIISALTSFAVMEKISNASFVAIGAVDKAELAHYRVDTQKYSSKEFSGAYEIANLTGNIFLFEGKPLVHAHITLGDEHFHTFSGHLVNARVSAACEVMLTDFSMKIAKKVNEKIGLKMIDL